MERILTWSARSVAFATLISTAAFCCADSPVPAEQAPEQEVAAAGSDPSAQVVDVKDLPRFKHTSYPAAWTAAQESNRPILVYVSMPQCPHCTMMLEKTYEQREVDELVKGSFETVQAGRDTHAALVSKLHVRWYPTTVLVGPNNKILDMIEGYVDANTFKRRLQLGIASAHATDTQTR
jgi:thioredoxin-like negative regulator of GroEL